MVAHWLMPCRWYPFFELEKFWHKKNQKKVGAISKKNITSLNSIVTSKLIGNYG